MPWRSCGGVGRECMRAESSSRTLSSSCVHCSSRVYAQPVAQLELTLSEPSHMVVPREASDFPPLFTLRPLAAMLIQHRGKNRSAFARDTGAKKFKIDVVSRHDCHRISDTDGRDGLVRGAK